MRFFALFGFRWLKLRIARYMLLFCCLHSGSVIGSINSSPASIGAVLPADSSANCNLKLIPVGRRFNAPAYLVVQNAEYLLWPQWTSGKFRNMGKWHIVKENEHMLAILRTGSPSEPIFKGRRVHIQLFNFNLASFDGLLPGGVRISMQPGSYVGFYLTPNSDSGEIGEIDIRGNVQVKRWLHYVRLNIYGMKMTLNNAAVAVRQFSYDSVWLSALSGRILLANCMGQFNLRPGSRATCLAPGQKTSIISGLPVPDSCLTEDELFNFSNEKLPDAMMKIARWYGISRVSIRKGVDSVTVGKLSGGRLVQYLPLRRLMTILETDNMKFKLQGQTIVVYRPSIQPKAQ